MIDRMVRERTDRIASCRSSRMPDVELCNRSLMTDPVDACDSRGEI
jgi:hypothetical protein